jgi:hypothetical protein
MRDGKESGHGAVARRRSEGIKLACAVAVALVLGVAFGIWLNARLAPASSARAPRPARLLPDARASAPPAPEAQPSPCDGCETSSTIEATVVETNPAPVPADKAAEAAPTTDSVATTDVAQAAAAPAADPAPSPTEEVAAASAEPHDVPASEAVAETTPDPSRPVAWQVGPVLKAGSRAAARVNVEQGAAQPGERTADGGAQAQPEPCVPYASANSLSLRVGGAAPLILGGPGVGVRINVSTPDRSDLEVIYEGPAGGDKGWLRYSVRSIGGRPGRYRVRVSTPCGSQTISVTIVKQ